jgi:16S rRNA (cytosine1402-N4)-methyltransferase
MSDVPSVEPTPGEPPRPKRRLRYPGKNPRRFEEKYKEHRPEAFPETIEKVVASGKTPAGTHRPILLVEVLEVLAVEPGDVVVDCTLGYGGHSRELLGRIRPGGRLIGLDVDPFEQPKTTQRLLDAGFGPEIFTPVRRNFAGLPQVLAELQLDGADAVLADLGVSSMQIDDPTRGFSFKADGPLDLRLNPLRAPSAAQLLATLPADRLALLFGENADEPHAELLAGELVKARNRRPLDRTQMLATEIRDILAQHRVSGGREADNDCVRRVFQALRIAVNDEFGALDTLLRGLPYSLKPGGRACILTFHSGEDRRVKKAFQAGVREGLYSAASEEVVRPSREEVHGNPRSASAKLRWVVRSDRS